MPLDRILSVHDLDVLDQNVSSGPSMTVRRDYVVTRTVKGRVRPIGATERETLARQGFQVSHLIDHAGDPGLNHGTRLRFRGTVLRVVPPTDYSGQERVYRTFALAHSEDNPAQGRLK